MQASFVISLYFVFKTSNKEFTNRTFLGLNIKKKYNKTVRTVIAEQHRYKWISARFVCIHT